MRLEDVMTQSNFRADKFTSSRWHSPPLPLDCPSEHLFKGSAAERSFQDGMNTYCRCLNTVLSNLATFLNPFSLCIYDFRMSMASEMPSLISVTSDSSAPPPSPSYL